MASDIVWPDEINENCLAFYNAAHKWYYISHQTPDELLVFQQMSNRMDENHGTLASYLRADSASQWFR